jgi:uncharacterized membrane protein YgcG
MSQRNLQPAKFFSKTERSMITQAVRQTEESTGIKAVVWLEKITPRPVLERAAAVYADNALGDKGVLFYLATGDRLFAIVKAAKIDQAIPAAFWEKIRDSLQEYFLQGQFAEGLEAALKSLRDEIASAGLKA